MNNVKIAGTAPFESLSFWLYEVTGVPAGLGGAGAGVLRALYEDPFDGHERAMKVAAAEYQATNKELLALALPPSDVNGKRIVEAMSDMARRQVAYMASLDTTPGPKPVLVPDASGRLFFYSVDPDTKILSPFMSSELPWKELGLPAKPEKAAQVASSNLGQAMMLMARMTEFLPEGTTVVPLPFDHVGGVSAVHAANEYMKHAANVSLMPTTKSVTFTADLDGALPRRMNTPDGAADAISFKELRPGTLYLPDVQRPNFGVVATQPNTAKLPDGGWAYAACMETGRLFSTVSDAELKWTPMDDR